MPAWGRRQSYPAVVGTTTFVVAIFTATTLLRAYIPDPDPNPVTARRGDFMQLASKQSIKWRTLEDRPFNEAKRTDKLVFLYVGCAWNWSARIVDRNILVEPGLAERLNREFIPVRVDASVRPEWEAGPFPLMASATGSDPGWYILVTQPDGTPLAWLARQSGEAKVELQNLQSLLTSASKLSETLVKGGSNPLAAQSASEEALLNGRTVAQPGDLADYASNLAAKAQTATALARNDIGSLRPWDWIFLLKAGMIPEATKGLQTTLQSSLVDWLHDGFFRTTVSPGLYTPRYETLAVENAEMAVALAHWYSVTGEPVAKLLAESTFDMILDRFWRGDVIYSYSWADYGDLGREPSHSMKPKLLIRSFTTAERRWLARNLDLNPSRNAAMVPRVQSMKHYLDDRKNYEDVFDRIRRGLGHDRSRFGGTDLANNVAGLAARLSEAARILGGNERIKRAALLMEGVRPYRVGVDGVGQALKPGPDAIAFLGDYLAYCDAALQSFLLTGKAEDISDGARVLKRAMDIFAGGPNLPIHKIPAERELKETPWVSMPCIVDGSQGSLVGAYVRLCQSYSLLLRDQPLGNTFREAAQTTVARYAPLLSKLTMQLGSFASSSLLATNDQMLAAVGDDALNVSLRLSSKGIRLLVAPMTGDLRKDLQSKGKGIWLCSKDEITGPLTEKEALNWLTSSP